MANRGVLVALLALLAMHPPHPAAAESVEAEHGGVQLDVVAQPVAGGKETGAAAAYDVLGKVNLVASLAPQDLRLVLHLGGTGGKQMTGFVRLDGSFTLRHVPLGVHVLEVFQLGFMFPQIRLEVVDEIIGENVRASYIGGDNRILAYPILVQTMGTVSYFEPRQGFSWRSFIFQPQIIMMLVMIAGLVVLPKMALDPEQLKEMQAMQADMTPQPTVSKSKQGSRRN